MADEGSSLVVADYSQIELRLMAQFAEEPALLDAFRRGEDVHRTTAAAVAGIPAEQVTRQQRERAKATNFGIMYGLSAFGLSEQVEIPVEEARAFIDAYFARYPQVKAFRDKVILQATEDGYVTTVLGRRRAIPELRARTQRERSLGERLAVNTVLQGSAADIIKMAMVLADARARAARPGAPAWCCRCTTSSSSRRRRPRSTTSSSWRGAACAASTTWTRRSTSTSASARTGATPSSGPRACAAAGSAECPARASRLPRSRSRRGRRRCYTFKPAPRRGLDGRALM